MYPRRVHVYPRKPDGSAGRRGQNLVLLRATLMAERARERESASRLPQNVIKTASDLFRFAVTSICVHAEPSPASSERRSAGRTGEASTSPVKPRETVARRKSSASPGAVLVVGCHSSRMRSREDRERTDGFALPAKTVILEQNVGGTGLQWRHYDSVFLPRCSLQGELLRLAHRDVGPHLGFAAETG